MRIIVIGAGKVGYKLAEHLTSEEHDVTVIDNDDEVIERCSGSLDVICLKVSPDMKSDKTLTNGFRRQGNRIWTILRFVKSASRQGNT